MRCIRCKASYEECHAESYEIDWYCKAGILENEREEDNNGNLGCKLHWKTIHKRIKINQKA